jgi:ribose/xylose/arabinose/galactoside ABC-type transport system permease subunit
MTFVILTGGIDLSVGSVLAVAALCAAALKSYPSVVVLVAVLLLGAACGLVNGTIVTRGRVQPFITTLGTMTILIGLGLTASGGEPILGAPKSLVFLGRGQFAGVPVQAILFAIVAALAGLLLKITRFGRHVYAVGGNEEASRLSGVSVDRVKVMVYMIAGVLAALGGLIMAEHLNVGEANLGKGLELDAIAAVVVGGTSLSGGRGGVGGTVIGVLLIGVLNNLLNLLDVPAYTQLVLKGCIIISAVLIQERVSRKA